VAGKDTNIGAKRAREARAAFGLEPGAPVACLLTLVEETLATPVVLAALPEDVAGACWRKDERTLIWVNGTQPAVRCRFTLAHELGHLRCGHDHDLPVDTFQTFSGEQTDSREVQANAFAAEFLMPADGVRERAPEKATLEDVVLLAAAFGTSTIAALYRLNTLEVLGGARYRRLKGEIQDGTVNEVWEQLAPEPFADALADLDPTALPRFSPQLRGTAFAALVRREASIVAVAGAAGCDPRSIAGGAEVISV
jgi:Zn-dependent peptidase ImmA (M78 family)